MSRFFAMSGRGFAALFLAAISLSACVMPEGKTSLSTSGHTPPMQWDVRPEGRDWTRDTLAALQEHDAMLAETIPSDVETWCPGYAEASLEDRRAFWAGLMSAVARYESTWNPQASGGGGRYIGIMQISPISADYHQCEADTVAELKDGSGNLECAARMMAKAVARDGLVVGGGNRGIGRDWMPFRSAEKRTAMAAWTRAQPYCQGQGGGLFAPQQSPTLSTKG
ncbi:transglycosylase SLT domain-containing protein [Fuscovulum ytuae]|uniref:Transglycosylase SLT domain-containing protein n=1 Tax=Fuscovulum ytuae TaxID=3042299 RepID=A0ABY8Q8N3_9RHOB|nr:transglycosylase SLT domain-containing protein [Fuscovulum sp. YMD61]WGV17251.1 transglycosylase SLT domain-containing protein [Fuscovulum sp. YMD61]